VLSFASFHIYAATKVPNTFNSGTPALASEVNENFQNLDQRIEEVDINKPTFTLESETKSPNGIDRTYVFSLEDDIELGQLFATRSSKFSLTREGGAFLAGEEALISSGTDN